MTYLLDFDRTLFDTDAFVAHLLKRPDIEAMHKASERKIAAVLAELCREGRLSFAPEQLKPFVYPDVAEFMRMKEGEVIIVTAGDPGLQKRKVESALASLPGIPALYTGDTRKGEFMKDRVSAYGSSAVFVDDRTTELESMSELCPEVKLFEMRRDGEPGDGRWPVVRTLSDLP